MYFIYTPRILNWCPQRRVGPRALKNEFLRKVITGSSLSPKILDDGRTSFLDCRFQRIAVTGAHERIRAEGEVHPPAFDPLHRIACHNRQTRNVGGLEHTAGSAGSAFRIIRAVKTSHPVSIAMTRKAACRGHRC